MRSSRARRRFASVLLYLAITTATLLVVDGICILLDIFPPTYDYGDQDLGWRPAAATGHMAIDRCTELSSGEVFSYRRNEDGIRTTLSRDSAAYDSTSIRIGVTGDSQTDLCAPNSQVHWGVLESALLSREVPATVLAYGAGKYSPLQDYLAFQKVLKPYHPQVLVMNIYTGNDFYDILREDDRPHFIETDSGYRLASPRWYSLDNPQAQYRSRVLFVVRTAGDKTGVRRLLLRLTILRELGTQYGASLLATLAYSRDLMKAREASLGYPDAFTAQFLNQQLFFHHFPGAEAESIHRMDALMVMIQQQNPGLILVMSPLPSYQLVGGQPVDEPLLRTTERLPLTYAEGQQQEHALYDMLRKLADKNHWVFVDNLAALQQYHGSGPLYNDFDYHLLPTGSAIVGRAEAEALLPLLRPGARALADALPTISPKP